MAEYLLTPNVGSYTKFVNIQLRILTHLKSCHAHVGDRHPLDTSREMSGMSYSIYYLKVVHTSPKLHGHFTDTSQILQGRQIGTPRDTFEHMIVSSSLSTLHSCQ